MREIRGKCIKKVKFCSVYAHIKATGMFNDHLVDCHRYRKFYMRKLTTKRLISQMFNILFQKNQYENIDTKTSNIKLYLFGVNMFF